MAIITISVTCENDMVTGHIVTRNQYLSNLNTPKEYEARVEFNNAALADIVSAAVETGVIKSRKVFKTPGACETMARGVDWYSWTSAAKTAPAPVKTLADLIPELLDANGRGDVVAIDRLTLGMDEKTKSGLLKGLGIL